MAPQQSVKKRLTRSNGDDTRLKILKAAKKLFVEHGYAGTSMGKIAALAGVNHSLLFHHFQNKKHLWYQTKVYIVEQHTGLDTRLPSTDQPFADFLNELVHHHLDYYQDKDLIRMLGWQRLEPREDVMLGGVKSKEMDIWVEGFAKYQQQGAIEANLEIGFVITMVLGIMANAALDPIVFLATDDDKKRYCDFVVKRLLKALTP